MPLVQSASKKALQKNIETEMKANPDPSKRAQNIAIGYSTQRANKASGGLMPNDMMNSLMKRRKMKAMAEGGRTEARDGFNTDPDLPEQSSQLDNASRFDNLLADETNSDPIDQNEALYANGGTAHTPSQDSGDIDYNANLKESYGPDEDQSKDESHGNDSSSRAYNQHKTAGSYKQNPQAFAEGGKADKSEAKPKKSLAEFLEDSSNRSHFDEGGPALDPQAAQSAQNSMRDAFNYPKPQSKARGGVVSPNENTSNIPSKSDGQEDPLNPLKKSGKAYQSKPIGNQGRPTIDLNDHRYARGGNVGKNRVDYNFEIPAHPQLDTDEDHDESSSIAMAQGGSAPMPKYHKGQIAYDEGVDQDLSNEESLLPDENSSIAMAEGGMDNQTVAEDNSYDDKQSEDGAKHLGAVLKDTRQSKDEGSSKAMASGGNTESSPDTEEDYDQMPTDFEKHLGSDIDDTPQSFDEYSSYESGGQINNDQSSGMNPKSMENEDEQEQAIKARRRKAMKMVMDSED